MKVPITPHRPENRYYRKYDKIMKKLRKYDKRIFKFAFKLLIYFGSLGDLNGNPISMENPSPGLQGCFCVGDVFAGLFWYLCRALLVFLMYV